jgi:RNA polymerase sigma-70 factor (ECF subfamily)
MLTVARSMLADAELANDAVQQAFVQAWRAASRYDTDRPLRPWLFAITRRVCIDLYRRDLHRPALTNTGDAPERPTTDVVGTDVELSWLAWEVREAVDSLAAEEREVIRLADLEGYSLPEVAARLQVPLGTVKSRSYRGHRRLAARLAHAHDGSTSTPRRTAQATAKPVTVSLSAEAAEEQIEPAGPAFDGDRVGELCGAC